MPTTLREKILATKDREYVPVPIPEWGITLNAAPLSARQQIEYAEALASMEDALADAEAKSRRRSLLVIFGTADESGSPIFKPEDAEALADKNFAAINRIIEIVLGKNLTVVDAKKNS